MNEYNFKFSGSYVELPEPLKLGDEIVFRGNGAVTNEIRKDMNDGAVMTVYTVRPVFVEASVAEGGIVKPPIAKDFSGKKSVSQRIRSALYVYWQQQAAKKYPDFEKYYEAWGDQQLERIKERIV